MCHFSLRRRFYGCFDNPVEFRTGPRAVTDKTFDQVAIPIEDERLRDVVIVAEIFADQIIVGKCEWILNAEFARVSRNFITIFFAANVQTDDLQSFLPVLALQSDQMRRFDPAGLAPGRVEVEEHDLALIVGQARSLTLVRGPTAGCAGWLRASAQDQESPKSPDKIFGKWAFQF